MSDVLQAINSLAADTKEAFGKINEGIANRDEEVRKFADRFQQIEAKVDELKRALPSNAPIDDPEHVERTGNYMSTSAGWKHLSPGRVLALPPTHEILNSKDRESLVTLQRLHDACVVKLAIWKQKHDETIANQKLVRDIDYKTYRRYLAKQGLVEEGREWDPYKVYDEKVMEVSTPANTTLHDDYLDFTALSGILIEPFRNAQRLAPLFDQVTLTRPNQTFPALTSDALGVLLGVEAAQPPPSTHPTTFIPGTTYFTSNSFAQRTFNTRHLGSYMYWTDDMVEDSVVPWLPLMERQSGLAAARALDRGILDGDATGAGHMDTDVTAAMDFRKAWYGLRKLSKNNWLSTGGNALDETDLMTAKKNMGLAGENPEQVIHLVHLNSLFDLIALSVVKTVDSFGDAATLRSGMLRTLWGSRVMTHEFVRHDMNASGVYENAAVLTAMVTFNVTRFVVATWVRTKIEQSRVAPMLLNVLQTDTRVAFGPWDEHALTNGMFAASATNLPVFTTINVS